MERISEVAKSWSFSTRRTPHFRSSFDRQILAPGDHLHAECPAIFGHALADGAKPKQTERASGKNDAGAALPQAFAHPPFLLGNVAHGRDHQAPGQLGRRVGNARGPGAVGIGMDDQHAMFGGRVHVEIGEARADDGDELETRQLLEQSAWQRHTLPDRAENIEGLQSSNRLLFTQMLAEHFDLRDAVELGPVGRIQRHAGIVIKDRHLQHACAPAPVTLLPAPPTRSPETAPR